MAGRIRTIAVGVDGSPNSRQAFDWAAQLAGALGAELVLVHAVGLLEHRDDPDHRDASEWLGRLRASSVSLERVIRDGDPVMVLESVAAERGADLVVVGSRGIGGAPSLLLGSTSSQLLQRSTVPVVVVPMTKEEGTIGPPQEGRGGGG